MTKGDQIVERGAVFLEGLSRKVADDGGLAAKLAEPLAEDAVFLRKLKPSLVAARLRGEAPPNGGGTDSPPAALLPRQPRPPSPEPAKTNGGPSPFLVAGAALVVGIFVAKLIDWRGHAHPRD